MPRDRIRNSNGHEDDTSAIGQRLTGRNQGRERAGGAAGNALPNAGRSDKTPADFLPAKDADWDGFGEVRDEEGRDDGVSGGRAPRSGSGAGSRGFQGAQRPLASRDVKRRVCCLPTSKAPEPAFRQAAFPPCPYPSETGDRRSGAIPKARR